MPPPTVPRGAASPRLHNDDLAPARERPWGAFSLFNVWTSDVHSLYGYYLAASLFLVARDAGSFLLGIGAGSIVVYVLMNAIGYAGQRTGVPYPVLARAAFGVFGANVPALVRAFVAVFWFGAQTSAAANALVTFLLRFDGPRTLHESSWLLGGSGLDAVAFLAVWAGQLLIISRGMDTVRWFTDVAGPAVWLMMVLLAGSLVIRAGGVGLSIDLPAEELTSLASRVTGLAVVPGTWAAVAAVAATWVTYFAALYLNFCDFTRFAPSREAVRKGNLWGLPVNLVAFSLVAALTTGSAYKVYGEVLLSPDAITARFDHVLLAPFLGVVVAGGVYYLVNAGASPDEGGASDPRRATALAGRSERP